MVCDDFKGDMVFGSMQQEGLIDSPCLYDTLMCVVQNVFTLKTTQSAFYN